MFRYVGLIWEAINHRHVSVADALGERFAYLRANWREAVHYPGLRVFCADAHAGALEPRLMAGYTGIVIGALYKSHASPHDSAPARELVLDDATTRAIRSSRGQWLIRNAWGNYVAIWGDPERGSSFVLKDPTGSLPAFSTCYEGVTILFSSIADVLDLGVGSFSVNQRALRRRVYGGDITHELDALNEVSQIRRGECVEFDPREQPSIRHRRFLWNPFDPERTHELIDDPQKAANALRETLRSCTRTLARPHASALLRLSGGLDSSIILGCLKDVSTPLQLLSYTQFTPETGTDPRPWAKLALAHRPSEQTELEVSPARIDLRAILGMAPSAEPFGTLMYLAIGAVEQGLAAQREVTAVFTGDGGDCVFGSFCIGEAVAARLRRHGPRLSVWPLAAQIAASLQMTTWQVLVRGVTSWVARRPLHTLESQNEEAVRLLDADFLHAAKAHGTRHPWFNGARTAPWETLSKLGALMGSPDLYASAVSPASTAPLVLAPIYAQPVVELAIRIPADVLFAGGRSRGLARIAFEDDVAPAILARTWKDRVGRFHADLIHGHLDWIRGVLLDGELVRNRLLDRAAVERALTAKFAKSSVFPAEIFRHLDTELWLQQWKSIGL